MIKILDCTLRDGGYYTNWDFSKELVSTYLESMNMLPVDYLEIGYRNNPMKDYLGEYFYCPSYLLEQVKEASDKKLVIILDEKNVLPVHVDNLLKPCVGIIDMVRIALDPQQFGRALKLAERIKAMGFEVGFNTMYMSRWREFPAFLEDLRFVDQVADYFYMVDSFGGVYPQDVIETINLIREKTNIKLGFHGHNNLELGLINTLTAIEHGVEIVDATITGMGRGAGNLKTELLLTAMNAKDGLEVDFNALSKTVDGFSQLQQSYGWGTNLPYMVSGANSLPQKNVMEWVTQRFYSFNSIIRALNNQKQKVKDNYKLPVFKPSKKYDNVVIIGGGANAVNHAQGLREFIAGLGNVCIIHASSKNANTYEDLEIDQVFCLVGNEGHRLEKVFHSFKNFSGSCVLPPYPREMGTYIPEAVVENSFELERIEFSNRLNDTHTALALQAALELGDENVFIAGYDGYIQASISQKEKSLTDENEFLFSSFAQHTGKPLVSLTPTNYKSVAVKSVYSLLA
ncbi:aldolase catalytic domain-containing protein [Pontibacter lucknowensis]|uniref:4-hydroxy 2-oxovalerate aldolase n=1 Tax=Pontibacter lucknowensis TaxID=1077936 RepID=A0A1N6Y7N4_9BACT|nr:aldolase catalytic domain-containing protein [Pontibacter lucknowensis]SIR10479.1 4-hydroxy 2-oxovalerate aldolase [Pontibacter lucknowensis]